MKHKITLIILLPLFGLLPNKSSSQVILTTSDLPQVGDVQVFKKLDSTLSVPVTPGLSGPGQTWNFSSLNGLLDTNYYVNPSSTPNGSMFPSSNIAIIYTESSGNRYEFGLNTLTGNKALGFDDPPVTVLDLQPYSFPLLTYGNSVNHSLRARFNVIDANNYDALFVQFNSAADAWGTITTPSGTVNVLRIYTTETVYDSSYVGGIGSQNSVTTGNYYYKWYTQNLGWPVLEISKGVLSEPNYKTVKYANDLSSVPTGVVETFTNNQLILFPNPASNTVTISTRSIVNHGSMQIIDSKGVLVKAIDNIDGSLIRFSSEDFNAGFYYIVLSENGNKIVSEKLLITK